MTFRLWAVAIWAVVSCAALFASAAASAGPAPPPATAVPPAATTPATGEGVPAAPRAPPKLPAAVPIAAGEEASAADWAATLERIAGSVVAIQIDQSRSFDTERNTSAQATGFVVDAERGLILTNRHVVTPGPVTAEATFLNREEVQ